MADITQLQDSTVVAARALSEQGTGALIPVLSLRDYFAAAALTGLCARHGDHEKVHARTAYALADAMLAARGGK